MILAELDNLEETAVYVHIPFCEHKCIYCDFYSIITKDNITAFLASVKKEIKHYSNSQSQKRKVNSIYFGGGTPSLMTPSYINEIILAIKSNFEVSHDAEITLETNPGTVDNIKLKDFLKAGINRLSIGVQSFNDQELKFLTRIHDKPAAITSVLNAAEAGFDNISIDLIFNLPNQSKDLWKKNLEIAVSLPVKHVSAYSLILERGTILNKMVLDGKVNIQDEDHDADLYEFTIDYLIENGFYQYEVSNFCKTGYECRHNNSYWQYMDYFGFGPSAHSFIMKKRFWNFSSLKKYIAVIKNQDNAIAGSESLSNEQILAEFVMLALRSKGLDIKKFIKFFGEERLKEKDEIFAKLEENGYLTRSNGVIKLTKHGYCVCDEIVKNLI